MFLSEDYDFLEQEGFIEPYREFDEDEVVYGFGPLSIQGENEIREEWHEDYLADVLAEGELDDWEDLGLWDIETLDEWEPAE